MYSKKPFIFSIFSFLVINLFAMEVEPGNFTIIAEDSSEIEISVEIATKLPTLLKEVEAGNFTINLYNIKRKTISTILQILKLEKNDAKYVENIEMILNDFNDLQDIKAMILALQFLDGVKIIEAIIDFLIANTNKYGGKEKILSELETEPSIDHYYLEKLQNKKRKSINYDKSQSNLKRLKKNLDDQEISKDLYSLLGKNKIESLLKIHDEIKKDLKPIKTLKKLCLDKLIENFGVLENIDNDPKVFLQLLDSIPTHILDSILQEIKSKINMPIKGDVKGSTYLHLAKSPNQVINLLFLGADTRAIDLDGKTPFARMWERSDDDAAKFLSKYDPSLGNIVDNNHNYPIQIMYHMNPETPCAGLTSFDAETKQKVFLNAIKMGSYKLVSDILKANKNDLKLICWDKIKECPLYNAIVHRRLEIFKLIFDSCHINSGKKLTNNQLLYYINEAISFNSLEIVKELCLFADINRCEKNRAMPLVHAIWCRREDIFEYFLSIKGIDLNVKSNNEYALSVASFLNLPNVVRMLLERNQEIDVNVTNAGGSTALIIATNNGCEEVVKLLLEQSNININHQDKDGLTALMRACELGYDRIAQLLLNCCQIDLTLKNKNGNTVLLLGCQCGFDKKIMALLLNHPKIQINELNEFGSSPLRLAIANDRTDIVKLILDHPETDVNTQCQGGKTCIMRACERALETGKKENLNILVNRSDIDLTLKDKNGLGFLDYALTNDQYDIVKLLIQQGKIKKEELKRCLLECIDNRDFKKLCFLLQNSNIESDKILSNHNDLLSNLTAENKLYLIFLILLLSSDLKLETQKIISNLCAPENAENINKLVDFCQTFKHKSVNFKELSLIDKAHVLAQCLLINDWSDLFTPLVEIFRTLNEPQIFIKLHADLFWLISNENQKKVLVPVSLLLSLPEINVNISNNGITPLMLAVSKGHDQIVKMLLENSKIDLDKKNNAGQTAFDMACIAENGNIIALFFDRCFQS